MRIRNTCRGEPGEEQAEREKKRWRSTTQDPSVHDVRPVGERSAPADCTLVGQSVGGSAPWRYSLLARGYDAREPKSIRPLSFWLPRRVQSGGQKEYRTRIAGRQKGGKEIFTGIFGIIVSDRTTCTKFGLLARVVRSAADTPGTPPMPDTPNGPRVGADSIHHAPRDDWPYAEREGYFTTARTFP